MACSSIKYLIKEITSDNKDKKSEFDAFYAFIRMRKAELTALLIMNEKARHRLPVVYMREATA